MSAPNGHFIPKRGRPSATQATAIDHAILDSARALFFDEGFDATAMERIASAAGVSKGTLYSRYPSKEALFSALVEVSVKRWADASSRLDDTLPDDIAERLRHHARTIAQALVTPDVRAFQRILLGNRERFPTLSVAMHDAGYRYIVGLIERDILDAAKRDDIPVRDAENVATILVSSITGWQLQAAGHHDLQYREVEAFALRMVDFVMAARSAW